ncbi:MAG TPA: dual specificity protein phosphatase family protein [Chitinophagaceae bacterium]|nr:dual specificity protein phosphatase family protein [Chitinophagaceae bacterium]
MAKNEVDKKSYWVKIGNGFLKIGHKPFGKKLSAHSLMNDKTDSVLTILSEKEGAILIGEKCKSMNIDWLWLPLPDGNIPPDSFKKDIIAIYEKVREKLYKGEKIYVHCSAGIHRTGMITHAFLMFLGYDSQKSFGILSELRPITAKSVLKKLLD